MFKRSRGRTFGRRKKNFVWLAASNDGFTGIAAGASLIVPVVVGADGTGDATLYRCRGQIAMALNTAGYNQYWGAAGLIVLDDKAAAVGITAVPSPWTQAGYDWLWHNYFGFADNGTLVADEGVMIIDAKAKRRVDDNQQVVLVIENQSAVTLGAIYGIRALMAVASR